MPTREEIDNDVQNQSGLEDEEEFEFDEQPGKDRKKDGDKVRLYW
jgi:hypothetical protein